MMTRVTFCFECSHGLEPKSHTKFDGMIDPFGVRRKLVFECMGCFWSIPNYFPSEWVLFCSVRESVLVLVRIFIFSSGISHSKKLVVVRCSLVPRSETKQSETKNRIWVFNRTRNDLPCFQILVERSWITHGWKGIPTQSAYAACENYVWECTAERCHETIGQYQYYHVTKSKEMTIHQDQPIYSFLSEWHERSNSPENKRKRKKH